MKSNEEIVQGLSELRLMYLAGNMDDFVSECSKSKSSIRSVLATLVERELEDQRRKSLERRIRVSKIDVNRLKPMCDFDWKWAEGLDRNLVERLMGLDFIKESANVILSGTEGLGKSMIAKNIGYAAVLKGHSVLFSNAAEMVQSLEQSESPRLLKSRLKRYTTPDLLIIDEFGYLSHTCRAADMLFEVINHRYENGSIIITTNMPFTDWDKIFPGATCIRAMIDRLIHRSEILSITGKSFRLKEANERQKTDSKGKK